MRVLFVHSFSVDTPGGAERWIVEVATRLRIRGHKVGVLHVNYMPNYSTHRYNSNELMSYNIPLYTCGYIKLPKLSPIIDMNYFLTILQDYNIIYLLINPINEVFTSILKTLLKVPCVAGFHAPLNPYQTFLSRVYMPIFVKILRMYDAVHVLSKSWSIVFKSYGLKKEKIFLIPNGVDSNSYYIKELNDAFRVLWTGRLSCDKGADILAKIIARFNEKYLQLAHDVEFVITGTGQKDIEKQIRTLAKVYPNVKYLGYVNRRTLKELYATSHLYIIPTRSEGMPLRVLEAMASGLPVVGSKAFGVYEILINAKTGLLVDVNDIDGYVRAILTYYDLWKKSQEEYHKLRLSIRRFIMKNYDWDTVVSKIEAMLNTVLR